MALHRHVFFFGGFDPKTPRHYHRMHRDAVKHHPRTAAGETVTLSARTEASELIDEWEVRWTEPDGQQWHSRHAVMRWDDIARAHWDRHLAQVLRDHWTLYVIGTLSGFQAKLYRGGRSVWKIGMFSLVVASCLLLLMLLLCLGVAWASGLPMAWMLALGSVGWFVAWRQVAARFDHEWVMRLYGFTHAQASGHIPELNPRLDALADALIERAQHEPARELLVVSHSAGAMMAVSVLARALQKAPWLTAPGGPEIALLNLGHCVPLLAWTQGSERFHAELAQLADCPALTWHDVTAPTDWAAFPHMPPWLGYGGRARRHQGSPRFHLTLTPEHYQQLLRNRMALHMHYLKAPDLPGGYDPVVLMGGPQTLAQRHAALTTPDPATP